MARKKLVTSASALERESTVSPIVEVNYLDPLFSVAAHPTKPILMAALGTGHLYCHSYNAEHLEEATQSIREKAELNEKDSSKVSISSLRNKWWKVIANSQDIPTSGDFVTNWKTKRHKGSCRAVIFDILEHSIGDFIYSVGTDHIIKKAATETGKVTAKTLVSSHFDEKDAITNLCLSHTHPYLLAGTENGHVLVFDSNELSSQKLKFKLPTMHEDAVNKILPMPAVSAYHYLTLGSTTLSHIDIRKGIITQSDDQSDELMSMCYATDSVNNNKNDTVLVSHGEGIVTHWKNSNNGFADQISRVKVNKNASIDAIVPTMNEGVDDLRNSVWCGDSEGFLHRVNYKKGKVVETRVHSSIMDKLGGVDEVGGLDIDYGYRLISSGMEGLKIWSGMQEGEYELSDLEDPDEDDMASGSSSDSFFGDESHEEESGSADDSADDSEDDSEDDASEEDSGLDRGALKEEEIPPIVRKKRSDVSASILKRRKRIIDINKITKKEQPLEEDQQRPNKKKQKKIKILTPNNGIAKFDGL